MSRDSTIEEQGRVIEDLQKTTIGIDSKWLQIKRLKSGKAVYMKGSMIKVKETGVSFLTTPTRKEMAEIQADFR